MSSRNAEAPLKGLAASGAFARVSITARLALLYTLSAFLMLAVSTGFLYWAMTESLEVDDIQFLTAKIRSLRTIVREYDDNSVPRVRALAHEVEKEGASNNPNEYYIFFSRILDPAGRVLIETHNMGNVLPAARFPPPIGLNETPKDLVASTFAQGRTYWLMAAMGQTADGRPVVIQVALDDTPENSLLRAYQRDSVVILGVGTLLFAALGVLIARRGMRPLADIARTAEHITATQLHERIDPERWPEELATLARSFDRMLERLENSFARLGRFSSDLAHELRTPIHNLMGQTEVILSRDRTLEEYRQVLESNLEEYNRLARMINGLLFLARAENPQTTIERAHLDARKELEAVKEFHEALAEDQGISVVCDGQAEIEADPLLFRRAVTNLVSNALRHTPEGGKVTLAVDRPADHSVVVTVTDNGPGIPAEELPRVFDRLYRWDRGSLPYSEGAGLGLAIVKSIMELHGGSVSVDSSVGRGTTFTLRFPAPPLASS